MQEEAEIYEVKSINEDGKEVVVYVTPDLRRMVSKSMSDEYGNVESKGVKLSDLPEGTIPDLKKL